MLEQQDFHQFELMNPILTDCIPEQFSFGTAKGRKVIANFKGGTLTSDGGLVLVAELDKKRQITARFADCFSDYRRQGYVEHSCDSLVVRQASVELILY